MINFIRSFESIKLISFSIIISLLIVCISLPDIPNTTIDAPQYIKAAENGPYGIPRPHATRFLLPFLIRLMKPVMNVHKGFFVIGTLSLIIFITNILILLKLNNVPTILSGIILFNPLIVNYYIHYYIPDLFFMALLSAYIIMIYYDKQYIASLFLILLLLTRETAIILSIIVIIISIFHKRRNQLILTTVGTLLGLYGLAIIKHYAGSTNIWGVPEIIYLFLKVPFTMLKHLGIGIYTNVSPYCDPVFTINLPEKYHIGKIATLGLCRWDPINPVEMCLLFLIPFGIGPLFLYYIFYNKILLSILKSNWLFVVFYYGIIIYFIGFIISVDRLRVIGYGWPLFWLFIPIWLFSHNNNEVIANYKLLLIIHCIICWTLFVVIKVNSWSLIYYGLLVTYIIIIAISLFLYFIAWRMINKCTVLKP